MRGGNGKSARVTHLCMHVKEGTNNREGVQYLSSPSNICFLDFSFLIFGKASVFGVKMGLNMSSLKCILLGLWGPRGGGTV